MMRFVRDLRLIPIALLASVCLLVIKVADLALDGSRWISGDARPSGEVVVRHASDPQASSGTQSWAQQMFNFPVNGESGETGEAPRSDLPMPRRELAREDRARVQAGDADITGSIAAEPAAPASAGAKPAPAKPGEKPGPKEPPKTPDGIVIPIDGAKLPSGAEREILERLQQRREELDQRARELDIRENMVKAAEQRITAHLAEIKEVEGRIKTETVQKN